MKHKAEAGRPKLVAIMTKHVDDPLIVGLREEVITVLQQIENVFGKVSIQWHEFTNCGVRHRQDKVMKSVTLEQNAYVAALRMFAHPDSAGKKAEDAANLAMHSLYCLLLGAVAILLLTSIDVADFVSRYNGGATRPI